MFKYAQIKGDGIAIGVSYLSGEVDNPDMILLPDDSDVGLGWRYMGGEWYEPEEESLSEEEIPVDQAEEDRLLIMLLLADLFEKLDEKGVI